MATKPKKAPVNPTLDLLKSHYPDAHCALDHESPFQLLIATILSAQCTDERVNIVTKGLFKAYATPSAMAQADQKHLEELIRSAGFYQNKAKNIKACAQALVERHGGEVPRTLEELVELAGVGRKTANVVLGNAFGIASGVVVDTHVARLSFHFGWTKSDNAVIIERELSEMIDKRDWILLPHLLIYHGRQICKARRPQCDACFLFDLCPQRGLK